MSKKKTLTIGIGIIAVCMLICVVYLFVNRSTVREPTGQELEAYAPYTVDWQECLDSDAAQKDIILSLCTFVEEETIGQNVYKRYTSDTLGDYLYRFQEIQEIALSEDSILYIQYTDSGGRMVFLGYSDDGLCERGIYDPETDTLFHELNGTAEVWMKFRTGIQWGA